MQIRRAVSVVLIACTLSCGGGGNSPAAPATMPAPFDARGSFSLQGTDYNNVTNTYTAANGGLIFCRRESPLPNTIWIRLAQNAAANGDSAPHIDIDLCNFAGSSTYRSVHDVNAGRNCDQGPTFAIWWHDGPSRTFVSRPASAPCSVSVTQSTGAIEGTFQCSGLTPEAGGAASLDIASGSFRCAF